MKFCKKCISDRYILELIDKEQPLEVGRCPLCESDAVELYKFRDEWKEVLADILEYFQLDDEGQNDPEIRSIVSYLQDWNILSSQVNEKNFLFELQLDDSGVRNKEILTLGTNVKLKKFDDAILNDYAVLRNGKWDDFVETIKYKNRFHSSMFNLDALSRVLSYFVCSIGTGDRFYRARISSGGKYKRKEMGVPPEKMRKDGRVSAKGIECLYLASSELTAVTEVRPIQNDFVCVGMFRALKPLEIIDLTNLDNVSPFDFEECLAYLVNIDVIHRIANEITAPMRSKDDVLNYVPTQFVVDAIRSFGYDGVKYKSTLSSAGFNYAMFDPSCFKCCNVKLFDVKNVSIEHVEHKK